MAAGSKWLKQKGKDAKAEPKTADKPEARRGTKASIFRKKS